MLIPFCQTDARILKRTVRSTFIQHPLKHIPKVRIARIRDGAAKVFVGMRAVTINNRAVTPEARSLGDHLLLKRHHCLSDLENGSGPVLRHERTVEQWLIRVAVDQHKVGAVVSACQQCGVIGWARHHGEDLTAGRFYGNDTSCFSL